MKKIFQTTQCLSKEVLERYAKGAITGDLRFQVENHLLDCPLCNTAVEGFAVVDSDTTILFNEIFEEIDTKTTNPSQIDTRPNRQIPWNNIAAGLFFLITLGAAFWYFQGSQADRSYLAYFETQDKNLIARSIDEGNLSADLQPGLSLFNNGELHASLSFFEDYLKLKPESSIAAYYAGMSALELGELGRAFSFLLSARLNDEQLYDLTTWGLVRIHLEREEQAEAILLLEELTKAEDSYIKDNAMSLLKELKGN